jgi:hypothetical protein
VYDLLYLCSFLALSPFRMSPLHRAVVAGHLCIVWELLNSGICPNELVNLKVQNTPRGCRF